MNVELLRSMYFGDLTSRPRPNTHSTFILEEKENETKNKYFTCSTNVDGNKR